MPKKNNSLNYETSLIPKQSKMSDADLIALSRMQPDGGSLVPQGLVLCDLCGQPVAGGELSSPGMYEQEMKVGRHFVCHSRLAEKQTKDAMSNAMRNGSMPKWDNPELSEDEQARLFNMDETTFSADKRDIPISQPTATEIINKPADKYYVPPAGSMPLSKIVAEGGLSANDPKDLVAPDNLPEQVKETKQMSASLDEEMKQLYANGDPGLQTQDVDNLST